jgi:SecD/SecF fusion protein
LLSAWVFTLKPIRKGLDIQGGVQFTYLMDTSKLTPAQMQNLPEIRSKLLQILVNRATGAMGVNEPTVLAKGTNEFVVELPGIKNLDEAKATMDSSARIEFYWAKNINTAHRSWEHYQAIDDKGDTPSVSFLDTKTGKTIPYTVPGQPGINPDYKAVVDGWQLICSGDDLKSAQPQAYGNGYIPSMTFSSTGAEKMSTWSRQHQNEHAMLAAVLDHRVLSIAGLVDNTILSDGAQIQGTFDPTYVTKLCDLLNAGSLPVDLIPLSSNQLDPTVGADAYQKMINSGVIAFFVISAFLITYYAFPGFVAFLALSLYVLFTLSVLKIINATFSLAGIAGFILSVGMAVDANILVFERVKEEVKNGKSLSSAINLGFRRALPAIADSNACTILTSLVLLNLGTGPVKGFATTLIIGVIISLFTAVTVTRSLLVFFVGSGLVSNPKLFALDRNWFGKRFDLEHGQALNVVQKAWKWFGISLATIAISIPFFAVGGFRLNVEFQGGYDATYPITASSPSTDVITQNLEKAGFRGSNVKTISSNNQRFVDITVPPADSLKNLSTDDARGATIATAAGLPGAKYSAFNSVSPSIQKETLYNAIEGVVVSSSLIILFLAFRFGMGFGGFGPGLRFAISAIGALLHDIFVVLGTAAIVGFAFKWEVSALFLTAMLTMIGFSVHDTIVIFDRIRENLRHQQKDEDFRHLIDRSITQSYARSINTSGTVIVTLLILVIFGTTMPDLRFFVTAMLIGIISGTYSSIYNASPILYLWDKAISAKKGPEHSITALARAEDARSRIVTPTINTDFQPQQVSGTSGRSYGQVRRRANAAPKRPDDDL